MDVAVREAVAEMFDRAPGPDSDAVELVVVSDPLRAEFARTVTAIETRSARRSPHASPPARAPTSGGN